MAFWKKEDLKKSKQFKGYIGERTIPISENDKVKETIEIREYADGGSILDVEQNYHFSFYSDNQAKNKFADLEKKLGTKSKEDFDGQYIEPKGCYISKKYGLPRIEISCLKEQTLSDEYLDIIKNPIKLQSVFEKADKHSDDLKGLMKKYLE